MRGPRCRTRWERGRSFPIPMRGNEQIARAWFETPRMFPIPMRGNEITTRRSAKPITDSQHSGRRRAPGDRSDHGITAFVDAGKVLW